MPIHDLFSKQQKRNRGEVPDVFQYTNLPQEFRVQVVRILRDALGLSRSYNDTVFEVFKTIHDALCREYGIFELTDDVRANNYHLAVYNFFLRTKDIERALDIIQLSFRAVNNRVRGNYFYQEYAQPNMGPDDAINELNERFREHGIGYQFESNKIIRVDSQIAHSTIIKPALNVLTQKIYAGANDEFLKAHEHYRHGRYKEALNECLKSFESVMKAICKKRNWKYSDADTAKRLLEICFEHDLIPTYLQAHFSSLRSSLESGVPTVRNKLSGHGQGAEPTDVPPYIAEYLLNLTATSILLLTNAEESL